MILAEEEPWVNWRDGVASRLHSRGTALPCVLEQRSAPGVGAPTHTHFDTGELIVALAGVAEVWVDGVSARLESGSSIILPPHSWHGFRNAGEEELHTLAVFGRRVPLVEYEAEPGVVFDIGATEGRRLDAHRTYSEGKLE